jgi:hypothetical protein
MVRVQKIPNKFSKVKLAYSFSDVAYNRTSFTVVGVHTSQVLFSLGLFFTVLVPEIRCLLSASTTVACTDTNSI